MNEILNAENTPVTKTQSYGAIEDLIGVPPGFLLRSGITIVGIFTATIVMLTYFISYPDKLTCQGSLTSSFPPIGVVSKSQGYIEDILVANHSEVRIGQSILNLHSTTDLEQLEELKIWIKKYLEITKPSQYLKLPPPADLNLGIIQKSYAQLQFQYNGLRQELRNDIYSKQVDIISSEIKKIEEVNNSKRRELALFGREMQIIKRDQKRNDKLLDDGAISEVEHERIETAVLIKEREYEIINTDILQNEYKKEQLALEKIQLQGEQLDAIKQYEFLISEIISNIESEITQWSESFLVKSPIDGTVSFVPDLAEKKQVRLEEVLVYIIPKNKDELYISARLPDDNIGKVEKGQRVILKFDAYPNKQFGTVISKVGSISQIPEQDETGRSIYEVVIPLDAEIKTDYDYVIEYKPMMGVQVEIITEERSLFQRIFDQFLRITKDI